jgi:hypothetical protein
VEQIIVAKQKAHKKADTTESMVKKTFKKRKKWKELDQDPEASDNKLKNQNTLESSL